MNTKLIFTVAVVIAATNMVLAARIAIVTRAVHEYEPKIRVTSSVLKFQEEDETPRGNTEKTEKYSSNGEWNGNQNERGYLKFAGVVGSGHIYLRDDIVQHFGKINDGLLEASEW